MSVKSKIGVLAIVAGLASFSVATGANAKTVYVTKQVKIVYDADYHTHHNKAQYRKSKQSFQARGCRDVREDRRDRAESRRDERVTYGRRDRVEDRFDRRESRHNERVDYCPSKSRKSVASSGRKSKDGYKAKTVVYKKKVVKRYR